MPYAYRSQSLVAKARIYDLTHHDSVEIVSMGDLHTTSPHVDFEMIRSCIAWLKEADDRYAVIPGDVFDTAIKGSVSLDLSERGMSALEGRHLLAVMLEPVREKILAVISGNHDDRMSRDTGEDSVDALCCQLCIPYFPEGEAFLQLRIGRETHRAKTDATPVVYHVYVTHGNAGGRLPGGKANSLLALRNIVHNADVYINGHGHTPMVLPDIAWEMTRDGRVNERKQLFVSCGASLKRAGYPVKRGFPPLARVWPTVTLYGGHKHMTAHIEH